MHFQNSISEFLSYANIHPQCLRNCTALRAFFLGKVQVFQSQVWLIKVALFLITPAVTDGGNSMEFHPSYASWEAAQ